MLERGLDQRGFELAAQRIHHFRLAGGQHVRGFAFQQRDPAGLFGSAAIAVAAASAGEDVGLPLIAGMRQIGGATNVCGMTRGRDRQ